MRKYSRKPKPLTDVQEASRINLLELNRRTVVIRNNRAIRFKWYGARLILLIKFYDKTVKEVAHSMRVKPFTVRSWCTNLRKPSDLMIERLSFYFEIKKEFFTKKDIHITITEQLTIQYIL